MKSIGDIFKVRKLAQKTPLVLLSPTAHAPQKNESYVIQVGEGTLDLLAPEPAEIDPVAILRRVGTIRRFGGEPGALTVLEHQELVGIIAGEIAPMVVSSEARRIGRRHDLHEGVISDIPSPVGRLLDNASRLSDLKDRLDDALSAHFGPCRGDWPVSVSVKEADQIAMAIEWLYVLRREPRDWVPKIPGHLMPDIQDWLASARQQARSIYASSLYGHFEGYRA